jgi:hypothetical protein
MKRRACPENDRPVVRIVIAKPEKFLLLAQ